MLSSEAALAVVEAAYDLDSAAEVWLQSLSAAFIAAIDGAYSGAAYRFDASGSGLQLEHGIRRTADHAEAPVPLTIDPAPGSGLLEFCRGRPSLLGPTELQPGEALVLAGLDHAAGRDHELLFLIASDGCFGGWLIGAAAPNVPRLSPAQRERWGRVAAHVAAAGRLRSALASALPVVNRAAHAQGLTARLRDAVVAEFRSSSGVQREAVEPGEAWSALAAGRWSLVSLFEIEGRCLVVARRNAADAADPRALTLRERDVAECVARGRSGKEIAYELGLRAPTVSQLLHNAVRKLGVAGVAQLATVVRGLGQLRLERDRTS